MVTLLLDIKPYVNHFDSRDNVVCGWLDKHFKNGNIPDDTIITYHNTGAVQPLNVLPPPAYPDHPMLHRFANSNLFLYN